MYFIINKTDALDACKNLILLIAFPLAIVGCGGGGDSSEPVVTPPQINTAPVANAGNDQHVDKNSLVTIDASASSDADNDTLSYQWSFIKKPNASGATLENATSVSTSFVADVEGSYQISLIVDDGSVASVADYVVINSQNGQSYAIVDTAQVQCYQSNTGNSTDCNDIGYDADYIGNSPTYAVSNDGLLVTDNITGLTWQQSSDLNNDGVINYADKLSQSEAAEHCQNLSYGGRDDWRLPNIQQAYSLILFSGKDASSYQGSDTSTLTPFIDQAFDWAFGDINSQAGITAGDRIIDAQYATSSLYVTTTMVNDLTMFGVNYIDGRIKGYPTERKKFYVRCVADNSDYGQNDFVDNSDGTISDHATNLMWQQQDTSAKNWDEAVEHCEFNSTANYGDWRLPNAKELHSLVDYSKSPETDNSAAIDDIFQSTPFQNEEGDTDWGYYWSSTTHVDNDGDGSNAVYIAFGRALGYMNSTLLDVHGAGAQRSNDKLDIASEPGANSAMGSNGTFYYKGPQGDILRAQNNVRCVRDITSTTEETIPTNGSVNILLLIGDDIGVDNISGYKEQPNYSAQTPVIDELASAGVLFRNVWANPKCSPSRASLLTGKHAFKHGVTHPGKDTGELASNEETIAELLNTVGYRSALFGKWHLGNSDGTYPTDQGFDYFSGSLANIGDYFNWQKTQISSQGGAVVTATETGYATEVVAEEALSWINQQGEQPWFVQLAFNAPHDPFHVPPKDKFSHINLQQEAGESCTNNASTDSIADCYRATVETLDTYIGELLSQLPPEVLENTLIIFIGDNGTPKQAIVEEAGLPFSKEHSKGTVYEGGINVPLVISAGSNVGLDIAEISDKVQIQDLFSTIAEIAGVNLSANNDIDSQSLLGYLDKQVATPENRATLFSELFSTAESIDRWAITDGVVKYINNESVEECYNLISDAGEQTNEYLASDDIVLTCDTLKALKPQ